MRIAIIADIHGNLVALESVLDDIARRSADQIICLGDVAATGAEPRQVLDRVRALNCPVVMGNADAELLAPPSDDGTAWTQAQLHAEHLAFMRTFQPTVEVPLGGSATMLCFHGSPRSYDEIIMATTPGTQLNEMLGGQRGLILAGGHTHVQMLRRYKKMMLINPGSVGLPYDQNPWSNESSGEEIRAVRWAEYAVVSYEQGRVSVEFLRV